MSISRYIVIAVETCSWACSRLPAHWYILPRAEAELRKAG